MKQQLIQQINKELTLQLPENSTEETLIQTLADSVNHLIQTDFQKLVQLLYRIDISEPKLKQLLKENPDAAAGSLIAQMIVERQLQKLKSRQHYSQRDDLFSEEEKW